MKSKLALATLVATTLVAGAAFPCGAPFGSGVNVDPRQDIVVVHKNGIETYVFQPRFCGSAKEFGLVLPVPAKLSAAPALAKAEIFTTLDDMSQPQIVYNTACANRGGRGDASLSGGLGDTGNGATVVSSGTVGFMDYAQLETASLDSLTAWLAANGYPYDAQATATFDYYVQKGWYFLTFKVSQGTFTGNTTCKDLGPVKFSFPSETPVVPTRMATARTKDTSGILSTASGFSWRIFGITQGSEKLYFTAGQSSGPPVARTFNYSGLIDASAVTALDGLAVEGDRATKLTLGFEYGSTEPDIALKLVPGQDYRETIYRTTYITCTDGGVDGPPADGADALVVTGPEPGPEPSNGEDAAGVPVVLDAGALPDLAAVSSTDAAAKRDTATPDATTPFVEPPKRDSGGGWCSFATHTGSGELAPALFALALLAALRRRRRR